jgi:hypothetical protein
MEAQQCYTAHGGRGATLASIMSSVSRLYRQHSNVFNGNSRVEATYDFQACQDYTGSTATYSRAETAYNFQHGSGHSRAAESMEADTQERRTIILEFTEQVSKCSEQVSVAFKSDKFEVPILFYNTALNNLKPLLCIVSNDYLTLNCYKRVSIFTGPEFS